MHNVCLTFDNGPDLDVTPRVLDTLAKHQIKASFFVLGKHLENSSCHALCERAVGEGHWIGNHTYTHETPLGRQKGADVAEREIARTERLIGSLAHPDKFFRPFGGGGAIGQHLLSSDVLQHLQAEQYTCVLWNVIPRDWEDGETWPERAMALMLDQAESLVVLHDIAGLQISQLERFIGLVRDGGGRFEQQFPRECVPFRTGRAMRSMDEYLAR